MEPITYKNENIAHKCSRVKRKINIRTLCYLIFVFFSARAPFFEGALPFGMALFGAEYIKSIPYLTGGAILLSFCIMPVSVMGALVSALAMLFFSLVKTKIKTDTDLKTALLSSVCICVSYLIVNIPGGINFYDVSLMVLQGVCVFTFVFLYRGFFGGIKAYSLLSYETRIFSMCALSVLALGMCGFGKVFTWGVFLFCVYLCLSVSYKNGIGMGAVCGAVSGIICGLSGDDFSFFVTFFTACALFGGLFSCFGKLCSGLAFIFSALLVTFLSSSAMFAVFYVLLTFIGVCVFMLLPDKYLIHTGAVGEMQSITEKRLKKIQLMRVEECADAVKDISRIYTEMCQNADKRDTSLLDRVTYTLCSECNMQKMCWGRNRAKTYSAFFVIQEICAVKGKIQYSDIPAHLSKNCIKRCEIVRAVSSGYELYKLDKLWSGICQEGRDCASKQLLCISDKLYDTVKENSAINFFERESENRIKKVLFMNKIHFFDVYVWENGKVAEIFLKEGESREKISDAICTAMGEKFHFVKGNEGHMVFEKSPLYKMDFSILQKEKNGNNICGDTVAVFPVQKGKVAALLCDGMGSGKNAHLCSSCAAEMAENMLTCGFETKNVLEIVNSSLVLKSSETSFSTADLFTVDLNTLDAQFYKMGAVSSFVKRGREVKEIQSETLPLGTFSKSDIGYTEFLLMQGDVVIMVSDGAFGKKEEMKKNYIGVCR